MAKTDENWETGKLRGGKDPIPKLMTSGSETVRHGKGSKGQSHPSAAL